MADDLETAVAALRRFNRFHTRRSGVLESSFMGSGLSLAEARCLFEIATHGPILAAEIRTELGLDRGYLSRIVGRFARRGWVERSRGEDRRQRPIVLTPAGCAFFDGLDRQTHDQVEAGISGLSQADRAQLVDALATVTRLLGGEKDVSPGKGPG